MDSSEKSFFRAISTHIPQYIVEEQLQNPRREGEHGQFRNGTLVFADVSGFTAMSEKLSKQGKEGAEELTSILNSYFTDMLDVVFSYGGSQLKFGGDAMLLLFLGHRHAARGVRCARRMQAAMKKFHKLATSQGTFRLEMSIGVNSGEFFDASVGEPAERLYHIFSGREINNTAMIEAVASAGEIFISKATLTELGDAALFDQEKEGYYRLSELRVRIKEEPVPVSEPKDEELAIVSEILADHLPGQLRKRLRANPEQASIEGEHRRVTVMFLNLLGTSELIESYGRERAGEIMHELHRYFHIVHTSVERYGGMIIGCDLNTRGDKLLIIFGAPVTHENDEERALLCAQEMRRELTESGLPLKQRIGINAGYVFSGEVGSPLRKEYTVMGDDVNLAARLTGVAGEGQILVGSSVYSRVTGRFTFKTLEPVRVKGKSQPVAVYEFIKSAEDTAGQHRTRAAGIVGRDREVAILSEVAGRALSRQGQALVVTGPAGIGKSRLVDELRHDWDAQGGLAFAGDCQSYGSNTPYLPWIDLLGLFFDLREGDTVERKAEKIEGVMTGLSPALTEWTAVMGNLLHIPIEESDLLKSLNAELRHQRLLDITLEIVQSRAKETPVLLLLENLQWADSASLELLNYLSRNIVDYPVLVVMVCRPEEGLELETVGQKHYSTVTLGELSPEASLALIRLLVTMKELPEELGQLVTSKAQGNPFYIEEVVSSLIDSEYLKLDETGGEYQLTGDLSRVEIPDTIQGVIMAHLDRLDEETRNVLRVAAVIGRLFQLPVVREIYPRPITGEDLLLRLDELVELALTILQTTEPFREYLFRHIMTQEVAYDSLLFARRRELHHKVGEYYEKHHSDRLEDFYELLCYHYGHTRDGRKTLEYAVKAGDKAKGMFANHEAIGYYRQALEIINRLPDDISSPRSRVLESLGDIYELTGQYDKALESYQGSQQWYESRKLRALRHRNKEAATIEDIFSSPAFAEESDRQIAVLCHKQGMVYERKGLYGVAIDWLDKGLKTLADDSKDKAGLYIARAGVLYRQGEHAQALDWCRQGLDNARRVSDSDETAHGCYLLGTIHTDMGNINQAIEYRRQSLSIYEETKDLLGQARVHNNLGVDYYYQGDWERAKEHYHNSLEIREKIGDVNGEATVANNLGEVLSDQGYLSEAIDEFGLCLRTWERIGYSLGVGLSHSNMGRAYTRKQQWQPALEHLEKSRQVFEELQSKGFLAEVYQRLAETFIGAGGMAKAIEYTRLSLTLAMERKMPMTEGVTRRVMGQAYRARGEWEEAEELLTESRRLLHQLGVPYELGQTLWQLALLHSDMADAGVAEENGPGKEPFLEMAIAIFQKLGIKYDEARVAELRARYGNTF